MRFRPDIQGLRAIAVVAVVLNHANVPGFSGGYVGVDVFFVISGFLISSHLFGEQEKRGRIRFGEFYARRARRILPASFTVLALSIAGAFVWVPPLLREQVLRDAIATAFYVPNYAFAVQGTDYLAEATPSLFQHYWSLGVEEQFYLAWPLLLAALFLVPRLRMPLLAVLVAVSFAACVTETFSSQPWAFFSLWTRAWELGLGGLVAAVLQRRPRWMPPRLAALAGWAGLAGILAASALYGTETAFPGFAAALPVLGTALVIAAGATPARLGPSRVLGTRPFQFVGLISYSLYLVHWPILVLAQAGVGYYTPLPLWATALLALSAVPVAWLLYRLVESPARRARARPGATLAVAGTGSILIAAVALVGILGTDLLPLNDGRSVARTAPTDPPTATAFVPSNMAPTLQDAAGDNPALYADGCEVGFLPSVPHPCVYNPTGSRRVVLFGDSHAAQWYPALQKIARADHLELETQTKSACASVAVSLLNRGVPYVACDKWRDNVIADLRAHPPALVIIADYTNPTFANPVDETEQWRRGLEDTIRRLSGVTKVALIADTPDLRYSPTVCLSARLASAASCGQPAALALREPGRSAEAAAASATDATFIDLTGYFCTATRCPAVIGNTLAYRDSHHISATYSAELAGVLGARITPLLVAR